MVLGLLPREVTHVDSRAPSVALTEALVVYSSIVSYKVRSMVAMTVVVGFAGRFYSQTGAEITV